MTIHLTETDWRIYMSESDLFMNYQVVNKRRAEQESQTYEWKIYLEVLLGHWYGGAAHSPSLSAEFFGKQLKKNMC